MTKMAAMPIYGKSLQKSSSASRNTMILKLGMVHWGFKDHIVYINDDPGLTMTLFLKDNLSPICFYIGNS